MREADEGGSSGPLRRYTATSLYRTPGCQSSDYPGGLCPVSGYKAEDQLAGGPWANYCQEQPGLAGMSCGAAPFRWPVAPEMWATSHKAVVGLLSDHCKCGLWGVVAGIHSPTGPPWC